jgi:asparagine synthase (glutamine-hydrolysing)
MVLMASEIKALFAMGVTPVWDQDAVFAAVHGCFSRDRTLFENIHQLPAGHSLRVNRHGVKLTRYWEIDFPRVKKLAPVVDETECALEVRRLLEEAVLLRMQADVPVGFLLSGGLDSSAMIGVATANTATAQQAFTVSFDSDHYDESSAAAHTATHLGAELCVVRAGDTALADCFADAVVAGEGLQYNAHGPARFLLSRAIRDVGYRAVMGGEGADEAFAGYGFVRNAATLSPTIRNWSGIARKALGLARPLDETERSLAQTSHLVARASRLIDLPPWVITRAADWLEAQRSILAPEFIHTYRRRDPFFTLLWQLDLRDQVLGRERARQMLYVWLRSIFAGYHLGADRLDMAHSVETRLPYLDHHLFDHSAQIPVATLAKGGRQKHLLREAARPYVTDSVYAGAKQPFYAPPLASEPGTALHGMVQDLLSSPAATDVPFLDRTGCLALLKRLPDCEPQDRATLDPILLLAASLVVLQQHYKPRAGT